MGLPAPARLEPLPSAAGLSARAPASDDGTGVREGVPAVVDGAEAADAALSAGVPGEVKEGTGTVGTASVGDGETGTPEGSGRGVDAAGEGEAVAEGASEAVIAGRRAVGTGSVEGGGDGAAGCLAGLPPSSVCSVCGSAPGSLPALLNAPSPPPPWPGASSLAGAELLPGRGSPSSAWDAGTPAARTSTAPTAAAAVPRRIPPWIPVRDMKISDLL